MNYHTFCTQICTKVNLVHKKNTDETGEGETIITSLLSLAILQDCWFNGDPKHVVIFF